MTDEDMTGWREGLRYRIFYGFACRCLGDITPTTRGLRMDSGRPGRWHPCRSDPRRQHRPVRPRSDAARPRGRRGCRGRAATTAVGKVASRGRRGRIASGLRGREEPRHAVAEVTDRVNPAQIPCIDPRNSSAQRPMGFPSGRRRAIAPHVADPVIRSSSGPPPTESCTDPRREQRRGFFTPCPRPASAPRAAPAIDRAAPQGVADPAEEAREPPSPKSRVSRSASRSTVRGLLCRSIAAAASMTAETRTSTAGVAPAGSAVTDDGAAGDVRGRTSSRRPPSRPPGPP